MKKVFSLILAMLMLVGLVGCTGDNGGDGETEPVSDSQQTSENNKSETVADAVKNTTLTLPYSAADGVDPYTLETEINSNLITLLYDSLYRLDDSFSPVELLADKGEVTSETVTVKIKSGVEFSDSSSLSVDDVIYSFGLAKKSDGYSRQLENISSAYAADSKTVVFKLASPDIYSLGCLTFPIVKSGSADGKKAVGSGRYYLSSGSLKVNKNHVSGKKASISKISLYDIKNSDSEFGAFRIGELSFAYKSLSDCKTERVTASINSVELNNLVFIGMKTKSGLLKDGKLRRIISYAVDRADIADTAFNGYATAAETPFNPMWKAVTEQEAKAYTAKEIADMLDENGYAYQNNTDKHRKNKSGQELVLTLAVNKNNVFKLQTAELIKSKLKTVGVDIEIVELSQSELKKAARQNKYDMYIGEIKLCGNMSLSPFFKTGGSAANGINKKLTCISKYNELLSGKIKIDEFIESFNDDTPFVPLCYRKGFAAVSNSLEDNVKLCEGDLYMNIYEWKFK